MKKILWIFVITLFSISLSGQDRDVIKGTVFSDDEQKEPVPFVIILLKQHNDSVFLETRSDINGKYELLIPDTIKEFVIEFVFIGFEKKEIVVNRKPKK